MLIAIRTLLSTAAVLYDINVIVSVYKKVANIMSVLQKQKRCRIYSYIVIKEKFYRDALYIYIYI